MDPNDPYAPLEGYGRTGPVQIPVLGEVYLQSGQRFPGGYVPVELVHEPPHRPRVWLPVLLFVATCLSTFISGVGTEYARLLPGQQLVHLALKEGIVTVGWLWGGVGHTLSFAPLSGLVYMLAVMSVLMAHEMGHFLQAVRYGVPASLPFFIPMPISPIGTMGAVIGMAGSEADRKQMFDIGISGPLAGLVLAVPMTVIGVLQGGYVVNPPVGELYFGDPLLVTWLIQWLRPDLPAGAILTMTPLMKAGWVGLLITGLNMLPISQLDGGHVAYSLFGKRAHILARGVLFAAVAFVVLQEEYGWMVMIFLVMLIGPDHPPTRDDRVPLGRVRQILGLVSLLIPILCLTPRPLSLTPQ